MDVFAVVRLKKKRLPKVVAVFKSYKEAEHYVMDQFAYHPESLETRYSIRKTLYIENYE